MDVRRQNGSGHDAGDSPDDPGEARVHHARPARPDRHRAAPRRAALAGGARRPEARADRGVHELGPPRLRRRRAARRDRLRAALRPARGRGRPTAARASSRRRRRAPRSRTPTSWPKAASGSRSSRRSPTSSRSASGTAAARVSASSSTSRSRRGRPPVADHRLQPRARHVRSRPDGERVVRRGGGGLVTALRGLVEHHDVTWIAAATTDEDRVVAAEGVERGGARRARARRVRRLLQRRREPDALVHPALALGTRPAPRPRRGVPRGVAATTRPSTACLPSGRCRVGQQSGCARCSSRTTTSISRPATCARRGPTPSSRTSSTSRGRSTGRSCPTRCARAVHDGLLANDVVAFHTARWARNFEASCAEIVGGCERTHVTHHAISIDTAEFDELRAVATPCSPRERALEAPRPEKLVLRVDRTDPSKNIVRGLEAFGLLLDEHPGVARPRDGCSRCSIRHGSRSPSTSSTSRRSSATAEEVNAPATRGAIELQRRGRLHALGRCVQAVRRAARERGLRRPEPRRQGGAARQRARRRARPVRERRRARGARATGR